MSKYFIWEFEFYKIGHSVIADPFELGEGTFGDDLNDAVECAADWLSELINYFDATGKDIPEMKFGHDPVHGGKIIAIAVNYGRDTIESVSAAEASRMLGVSRARVTQLCKSGLLTSWNDENGHRFISLDSVKARLEDAPKTGRPRTVDTNREKVSH